MRSNPPSMLLTALVAMVLLAGCAPFAGPPGPITYIAGHGQPAIVCLGDSLTAGDAAPQSESYPAWLQRRLTAWGYNYRVVNAGSSGDRVAGGLARLRADVLSYRPAIAVV
ncbi:MAG: GDSL-type esterase/lipase family protein, partial [Chloroflexota bacterium]